MQTKPLTPTHCANHPAFNYYGRWQLGAVTTSINSGSLVEFACTGARCSLLFDVAGFSHFPAIFVQVDDGPVETCSLSPDVSSVAVSLRGDCHRVRWWVGAHSLYLTEAKGRQWTELVGGCRFLGVALGDARALKPLAAVSRQIEFLGDSITQGLRLLYNGKDDDTGQQRPYANWPQRVAEQLGMRPVVVGFGGQGLTTPGTCGAPPAEAAFPFVCHGVRWVPDVQPEIVVIYQGTNDPVDTPVFRDHYRRYLRAVRHGRPVAHIVAVCPHLQGRYASAIAQSVAELQDARMHALDYSADVLEKTDTSDGCHLNPAGAERLARRLTSDLQRILA